METEGTVKTVPTPVTELSEPGDHDRFSHIVFPKDKLTEAYVLGTPIEALCGHVWVPSRDPKKYPLCPTCIEVFDKTYGPRLGKWEDINSK